MPLAEAAQLLCAAFAPTVDPSDTNLGPTPAVGARPPVRPLRQAAALPFAGREEARAVEIGRRGREAILSLAWSVASDDPVAAARQKPLALLAMALTSPHAGSLSARQLRLTLEA